MATKDMKLTPDKDVMKASKAVGEKLRKSIDKGGSAQRVQVKNLELTEELAEAFYAVASGLAEGRTVIVGTAEDDLTTTRAAAELGMSRPTLINLLQAGELDYHMVGSHRRIARREVQRYKEARDVDAPAQDEERRAALRRMAEISSQAGEGY